MMKNRTFAIAMMLATLTLLAFDAKAADGDFVWAKAMGGTGDDEGNAIAVDSAGSIYTAGCFAGTADFDPGPETFNLTATGSYDIYVSKLDSVGNFVWAGAMGGTEWDEGFGIAVDSADNVYITGYFRDSVDFDPGPGNCTLNAGTADDIFVLKLDSAGNFVWARNLGGASYDVGWGITVDSAGNVYTTGWFGGTADFDPGPGTFELTSAGGYDIFVSKLDSAGNFLLATAMGGMNAAYGRAISVDSAGNVYITGDFHYTVDFDPGPGTFELTSAGDNDIFVSKLDSAGNFVWAAAAGEMEDDRGVDIALDSVGNSYVTGWFDFTVDFDPGPRTSDLNSAGNADIFVWKLDSAGNLVWAKAMGGTVNDEGFGIAVDSAGNVYTAGFFAGTADFDPGPGMLALTSTGGVDAFVSKLDSAGSFLWVKAMGGAGSDWAWDIAADNRGNLHATGFFEGTGDFSPGLGSFSLTSSGLRDIFVLKLSGPPPAPHSADTNGDFLIDPFELSRVVGFYNAGAYQCAVGTEDGYAPGPGSHDGPSHSSDYEGGAADWTISFTELSRLVAFYNAGCYQADSGTEDGFAPCSPAGR